METQYLLTTAKASHPWTTPAEPTGESSPRAAIARLANRFGPISLAEMDGVALLDRIDTKFVMTTGQLASVLASLLPEYYMLAVNGQRLNHYRTLYFDTPQFDLYRAHINDRPERYKVRSREYTDTNLSYLEVKHRTRKDRTVKERMLTAHPIDRLDRAMENWLAGVSPLDGGALEPKLWNTFTRLTLVSKHFCERVTLDIDLAFYIDNRVVQLDRVAVAEVKMDKAGCASPFLAQMRARRIHPRGFSKYAMGTALLFDGIKKNPLKPKLLWLEKLMNEEVAQ